MNGPVAFMDSKADRIGNGPGRRALLSAAAGTALARLLDAVPSTAAAQPNPADDGEFLQLSRLLTGHNDLNPEIGRRLNRALSAAHDDFGAQVSSCAAFAHGHALNTTPAFLAALDTQAVAFAPIARTIIAAWYTGIAGDGPQATVIAYPEALMFGVVGDVLTAPSYCRAAPDYWTAKPPSA
jgi:hypothetical protein